MAVFPVMWQDLFEGPVGQIPDKINGHIRCSGAPKSYGAVLQRAKWRGTNLLQSGKMLDPNRSEVLFRGIESHTTLV